MSGFLIILSQLLADLRGTGAHHGILAGIVISGTAKYLNPKGSFLQRFDVTVKGLLRDAPQQTLAAAAAPEMRATENTLQFCKNFFGSLRRQARRRNVQIRLARHGRGDSLQC